MESPCDAAVIPDGAALSAFQYFENVRNFLVAAQRMGVPVFEVSDLEQVCPLTNRWPACSFRGLISIAYSNSSVL